MANALRGDFGVPFQSPTETVTGLIARTWPVSASLGMVTLLVAFPLGFLLGVLAAMRQNTWVDYATSTTATMGLTVPNFVVAVWLLLLFAVQLRVLPTGGWGQWYHYIMPVIALALAPMALTARYTRISILEVSRSDFIRTAKAKGLSSHQILMRHTLRNALIPLHYRAGAADSKPDYGHDFYREHLSRAGAGQIFRNQHSGPRLPDDHGAAAAGGSGLVDRLSDYRHLVCHCRPARAAGQEKLMTSSVASPAEMRGKDPQT